MHTITIDEKRDCEFEEQEGVMWEGLEGRKSKGDMLQLNYNLKDKFKCTLLGKGLGETT